MISLYKYSEKMKKNKHKLVMDFDFAKSTNKRLFNRLTFKNLQKKYIYLYTYY